MLQLDKSKTKEIAPTTLVEQHALVALSKMQRSLNYLVPCCSTRKAIARLTMSSCDEEYKTTFLKERQTLSKYALGAKTFKKYATQFLARIENEERGITWLPDDMQISIATFLGHEDLAKASGTCYQFYQHMSWVIHDTYGSFPNYFQCNKASTIVSDEKSSEIKPVNTIAVTSTITLTLDLNLRLSDSPPSKYLTIQYPHKPHEQMIVAHDVCNIIPLPCGYFAITDAYTSSYPAGYHESMMISIYRIGSKNKLTYFIPAFAETTKVNNIRVEKNGELTILTSDDKARTLKIPSAKPPI